MRPPDEHICEDVICFLAYPLLPRYPAPSCCKYLCGWPIQCWVSSSFPALLLDHVTFIHQPLAPPRSVLTWVLTPLIPSCVNSELPAQILLLLNKICFFTCICGCTHRYLCVHACMSHCTYGAQRTTCRSQFSPSTTWVLLGIKLRLPSTTWVLGIKLAALVQAP